MAGDSVCICSRSGDRVKETVSALSALAASNGVTVKGTAADVAKPSDVSKLAQFVQTNFGTIDIWINNAVRARVDTSRSRMLLKEKGCEALHVSQFVITDDEVL